MYLDIIVERPGVEGIGMEKMNGDYIYEKYMKRKRSQGDKALSRDFFYCQMKPPVPGMGYVLWSCWPNVSHENPQTTWAISRLRSFFKNR